MGHSLGYASVILKSSGFVCPVTTCIIDCIQLILRNKLYIAYFYKIQPINSNCEYRYPHPASLNSLICLLTRFKPFMSRFCIIDRCEVVQSHDTVAPAFSPLRSRLVCLLFLFRLYCTWPIPELVYSEAGFLTHLLDTPQLEDLGTLC